MMSADTWCIVLFNKQIDQKIANSWKTYAFMDNVVLVESTFVLNS